MANQIPFSGLSDAAGGIVLPVEQGQLLTNGLLRETAALSIAGDRRSTNSRREQFPIWLGLPTADFVGEGGTKPVTGGEFGGGTINIKKVASIVLFTDEMIEDVQSGDLNVLVDSGVREAIADVIDANVLGKDSGTNITTNFDTMLRSTTSTVEVAAASGAAPAAEQLRLGISAAMGSLEANGYNDMGLIIPGDVARFIRDARAVPGGTVAGTDPLFGGPTADPFYGIQRATSTNLNGIQEAAGANKIKAFVVSRPNLHVRIRHDVRVSSSREASVVVGGQPGVRSLWQENLTGVRYETRLGFWVHDLNRAVVAITDAS